MSAREASSISQRQRSAIRPSRSTRITSCFQWSPWSAYDAEPAKGSISTGWIGSGYRWARSRFSP